MREILSNVINLLISGARSCIAVDVDCPHQMKDQQDEIQWNPPTRAPRVKVDSLPMSKTIEMSNMQHGSEDNQGRVPNQREAAFRPKRPISTSPTTAVVKPLWRFKERAFFLK
jgi:hypothetical protein